MRVAFAEALDRSTALLAAAGLLAAGAAFGLPAAFDAFGLLALEAFELTAFLAASVLRPAVVARLAVGRTRAPFFWRVLLTWNPMADLGLRRFDDRLDDRLSVRRFIRRLAIVKQAERLLVTGGDP